MQTLREAAIQDAKRFSVLFGAEVLIWEGDGECREFFRFEEGELIEYDCPKYDSRLVLLKKLERQEIEMMNNE